MIRSIKAPVQRQVASVVMSCGSQRGSRWPHMATFARVALGSGVTWVEMGGEISLLIFGSHSQSTKSCKLHGARLVNQRQTYIMYRLGRQPGKTYLNEIH